MKRTITLLALASLPLALTACELAPKISSQNGYRGTGMNQVQLASVAEAEHEVPAPPYELPPPGGPSAGEVYQNVQVLNNVSADEFNYLMAAITQWVAPEQGCNYCHNPANMASDEVYTKVVARKMIQMTQNVNANWESHVAGTGVTCWTCHRGNNIPKDYWTLPDDSQHRGMKNNRHGQNNPVPETAYSSLPTNAVARYFLNDETVQKIRVGSTSAYPSAANKISTKETENTYALMMHMSASLGVNCTFCHNTQNFAAWNISPAQRATAWHGTRMVANMNQEYITPLTSAFPANRLGSQGDPFKVNCTTCHQGVNKPMGGAQMAKDYPALKAPPAAAGPAAAAPAAAAPAQATEPAAAGETT